MNCRHCATRLSATSDLFVDLGTAPPSNAYLSASDLDRAEQFVPLKVFSCPQCRLVQIDEVVQHDAMFSDDYAYFSSFSASWLAHARAYVNFAVSRLSLDAHSLVVEIASNDGYLLQYVRERGIPCVGVEPTASTARVAREKGIETIEEFFGERFAREFVASRRKADLVIGNNVLAHVPNINDFVAGLREALSDNGAVTVEFPHLMQMVQHSQFDTIYHEHFSYLSLQTVQRVFAANGLTVWDVQELPTHGGSLRVWAQLASCSRAIEPAVAAMLSRESDAGMDTDAFYSGMQSRVERIKNDFVAFLIDAKRNNKRVVGYGAAAKGNTLLNFAGVRSDLVAAIADASPHKQGRFMPGSRIPIVAPAEIDQLRPDYIVIFPWNLREEIAAQLVHSRGWGAKFVTAIPELVVT